MSAQYQRSAARASPASEQAPDFDPNHVHLLGHVRVLTCGSVDDGKSTLIGRLLWDASDLFDDQREALRTSTRRVLNGTHLDYSLLVDGLLAEREQGITIDIAWRYFDTADRRFTIIDSPGHTQYTRNMASGATHADVAIMLIDARHGIKAQTKRHAALLDLFGVRRVILAVNKMDLAGWSEQRFRELEADLKTLAWRFRFEEVTAIPVAAVTGDNVARRSAEMPWYIGPTLLDQLNRSQPSARGTDAAFRMPVQMVLRDGQDFRGLAGTVTAGAVSVGDEIVDVAGGGSARVARIATMDGDLAIAPRGKAVTLVLDRDIDVSRGAVLASTQSTPVASRHLDVRLVWMADAPFDRQARYLLRTATDLVPVASMHIKDLLDLETLARRSATDCATNDIVVAAIELGRATAVDAFAVEPQTGCFVLVDAISGATVAGGIIASATASAAPAISMHATKQPTDAVFRLTHEMLADGVCSDLTGDNAAFERRARAAVDLLRLAGVVVNADDVLPPKR